MWCPFLRLSEIFSGGMLTGAAVSHLLRLTTFTRGVVAPRKGVAMSTTRQAAYYSRT